MIKESLFKDRLKKNDLGSRKEAARGRLYTAKIIYIARKQEKDFVNIKYFNQERRKVMEERDHGAQTLPNLKQSNFFSLKFTWTASKTIVFLLTIIY